LNNRKWWYGSIFFQILADCNIFIDKLSVPCHHIIITGFYFVLHLSCTQKCNLLLSLQKTYDMQVCSSSYLLVCNVFSTVTAWSNLANVLVCPSISIISATPGPSYSDKKKWTAEIIMQYISCWFKGIFKKHLHLVKLLAVINCVHISMQSGFPVFIKLICI
jgi:hypothetical protein